MRELPATLVRLIAWLEGQGFDVHARERSLDFGEFFQDHSRGVVTIRMDRDRDGNWLVSIRAAPGDTWYDVSVWQAYLDGPDVSYAASVDEMVDFVVRRLPDIEHSLLADPIVAKRLASIARELTVQELGLTNSDFQEPP
jgi:hypothetical protein